MSHFRKRGIIYGLALVVLLKGLVWAGAFPLFQAPDEQAHFSYVQYVAENKRLPRAPFEQEGVGVSQQLDKTLEYIEFHELTFNPLNHQVFSQESLDGPNESKILEGMWSHTPTQNYFAYHYPPLYYLLNVPIYWLYTNDIFAQGMAMRLLSVGLSLITVFLFYGAAWEYFKKQTWAIATTLLIVFQPMFSFISATINNDQLLNLAYAGFFWEGMKTLNQKGKITWRQGVMLLMWTILGIAAKTQGYGLVALCFILLLFKIKLSRKIKWVVGGGGFTALAMLFLKSAMLREETGRVSKYIEALADLSVSVHALKEYFFESFFESFWGTFGWLDTPISNWIFLFILGVSLLSGGGLVWHLWKERGKWAPKQLFLLISIVLVGGVYIVVFWDTWAFTFNAGGGVANQGRYWFIILFPITVLMMEGLWVWLKSYKKLLTWSMVVAMAGFNLYALYGVVIPRYYQDTEAEIKTVLAMESSATQLNAGQTLGQTFYVKDNELNQIEILVYEPEQRIEGYFYISNGISDLDPLRSGEFILSSHNNILTLDFSPIEESAGKSYYLYLKADANNAENLTMGLSAIPYNDGSMTITHNLYDGDLIFQIGYESDASFSQRVLGQFRNMSQYKPVFYKTPYTYLYTGGYLFALLLLIPLTRCSLRASK